jgi:hypothetical protein
MTTPALVYTNWLSPTPGVVKDKWYHFAFVKESSSTSFKAYFNSTLILTRTDTDYGKIYVFGT